MDVDATWTDASGLTDPAGLSRSGTTGTLVLDSTTQTGFTGTDLPDRLFGSIRVQSSKS